MFIHQHTLRVKLREMTLNPQISIEDLGYVYMGQPTETERLIQQSFLLLNNCEAIIETTLFTLFLTVVFLSVSILFV